MLKNPVFAAIFTSVYLAVYCVFTRFPSTFNVAFSMFVSGPVLMVWLAYTIIKYGKYTGKELNESEFGYQDKKNGELGMF